MFKMFKGIFVGTIVISIGLTACSNKENADNKDNMSFKPASFAEASSVVNTVIKVPDSEGNSKHISITQKKVTIYTIDVENEQVVPKTSMMPLKEELKPEAIIESVLLELDDLIDDDIGIKTEEDGDSITVDFAVTDKSRPFSSKHQINENMVLECISYSILDNFTNYKKIYFKLNGEAYTSKQLKLSEKKPFMANE